MNIAIAITFLFPDANSLKDFEIRNDGPTYVLREGVDGRTRTEIRPLTDGETEEIEGVHYWYTVNYHNLTEGKDYDIVDRGPYIAAWNLDAPQPTEAELQAAWEAYLEAEANKPPELTEVETLQLALTDTFEQLLAAKQEARSAQQDATKAQVALADLYELTLHLQTDLTDLKGGVS